MPRVYVGLTDASQAAPGETVEVYRAGRWVPGKVIRVGRTRVTVAYTTPAGMKVARALPPARLRREEVAHLPAPWRLVRRPDHYEIVAEDGKGGVIVAEAWSLPEATVIVTAPDGYALAREIVRGGGDEESHQRAIDLARAILAKVEGPT